MGTPLVIVAKCTILLIHRSSPALRNSRREPFWRSPLAKACATILRRSGRIVVDVGARDRSKLLELPCSANVPVHPPPKAAAANSRHDSDQSVQISLNEIGSELARHVPRMAAAISGLLAGTGRFTPDSSGIQ